MFSTASEVSMLFASISLLVYLAVDGVEHLGSKEADDESEYVSADGIFSFNHHHQFRCDNY